MKPAANEQNYYEILGVDSDASAEQLREAYLDLAFIVHPDRLPTDRQRARLKAEAYLKRVNEAYEVLADPCKRAAYDFKTRTGGIHRNGNDQAASHSRPTERREAKPAEPRDSPTRAPSMWRIARTLGLISAVVLALLVVAIAVVVVLSIFIAVVVVVLVVVALAGLLRN